MEDGTLVQLMDMVNKSIDKLRDTVETKIDAIDEKVDNIQTRINDIDKNVSVHITEHEIKIKALEDKMAKMETSGPWIKIKSIIFSKYIIPVLIAIVLLIRGTFGAHVETYIDKYLGYKPKVEQVDTIKRPKFDSIKIDTTHKP